jgi:acyl-coenzyme A synthetase/AMP-(fatty) acid ligase
LAGTLIETSKWWATERKDVPAVVTQTDQVTFGEIDVWADALGNWLIAEGVQLEDRAAVYADDTFDPARALERIKEDKITALMGAPVFFERIAACEGFEGVDFSSVRLTSVGGARVSRRLLQCRSPELDSGNTSAAARRLMNKAFL